MHSTQPPIRNHRSINSVLQRPLVSLEVPDTSFSNSLTLTCTGSIVLILLECCIVFCGSQNKFLQTKWHNVAHVYYLWLCRSKIRKGPCKAEIKVSVGCFPSTGSIGDFSLSFLFPRDIITIPASENADILKRYVCPYLWLSVYGDNEPRGIGISPGISWWEKENGDSSCEQVVSRKLTS